MIIDVGTPQAVVPAADLPSTCVPDRSNNNLDACLLGSELFLAFRTAPTHFASRRARIELLSRDEGGPWRHETSVVLGRDVREPRLVVFGERLLLYFFTAGVRPTRFEPDRIHMSERLGTGRWSAPRPVSPPDHVVWRVRPVGGRLVMSCYRDASGAYTTDRPPRARFLVSDDGVRWEPLFDTDALGAGTTETDFTEHPDGGFLVVSRKESRGSGLGSVVARINPDGTASAVRDDPRKFDSPAMFDWRGRTFLVARRQRVFGGRAEVLPPSVPGGLRDVGNQLAYWLTPKATALFEVDPGTLAVEHVTDLPGCGDTAFAAVVGGGTDDEVVVFNYSSPLKLSPLPWVAGQLLPTAIHRVGLRAR